MDAKGVLKSGRLLLFGIIKRFYWFAPTLFFDPFDLAERYLGVEDFVIPQLAAWLLLGLGITIAAALTYHELRMQNVKLEKDSDVAEKNRKVREKLGDFLSEGQWLIAQCEQAVEPVPWQAYQDWAVRVQEYMYTNLERTYLARFNDETGIYVDTHSVSSGKHYELFHLISRRATRLNEFIQGLST